MQMNAYTNEKEEGNAWWSLVVTDATCIGSDKAVIVICESDWRARSKSRPHNLHAKKKDRLIDWRRRRRRRRRPGRGKETYIPRYEIGTSLAKKCLQIIPRLILMLSVANKHRYIFLLFFYYYTQKRKESIENKHRKWIWFDLIEEISEWLTARTSSE